MKPLAFARPASLRSLQRGQSLVEYTLIGGVLVLALFVVDVDGRTMAQVLVDSIRLFFRNMTFFVSLP